MPIKVLIRPQARDDILEIYDYLAERAGRKVAHAYIGRIENLCLSLSRFPQRGVSRPDLAAGIRTLSFERRAIVAYRVDDDGVRIVRVFHAGRDYGDPDLYQE